MEANLRDPIWGQPPWPAKFSRLRDHQVPAVTAIVDHFNSGADVVILDAPTGAGKTSLAEAVRRILNPQRTLYCPDSIQLQNQFVTDFPYSKLLKGRSNYKTADRPNLFYDKWNPLTAADCLMKKEVLPACGDCSSDTPIAVQHCRNCHPTAACPYLQAKNDALYAPLAVLNTSYLIAEANSAGRFAGADLVIIDEADTLANTLLNQTEIFFSAKRCRELDLNPPDKKTVPESWLEWVNSEAIPKIKAQADNAGNEVRLANSPPVDLLKRLSYLTRTLQKLYMLRRSLELGNAVYDGYDKGDIKFQPVQVAPFGPTMIWQHANRFLLMSATIIDANQRVKEWGIEEAGLRWELVKVPSTFDKARRPIHVKNAASMTFKEKDVEWPKMVAAVKKVLALRPEDRTLIHTVSYDFTQYLFDQLRDCGRTVLSYTKAKEREAVLRDFRKQTGAVLLAPSMDRGVDLPMDECTPAGTLVRTVKGYKAIETIEVGDRVWTHAHRHRRVMATNRRWYEGELVGIQTYMGPTQWFTPEHPILTSAWGRRRSFRLPSGTWVTAGQVSSLSRRWIPAGELTEDDRPVLATGNQPRIMKPLGAAWVGRRPTGTRVRNQWDDTPAFWRLVGLWAAEGSLNRLLSPPRQRSGARRVHWRVVWSFGAIEEMSLASECADLIEKVLGNVHPTPKVYGGNDCRVAIKNSPFAVWLQRNVGKGAANKTVPTRLMNHPDPACRAAFLEGYWAGDGNHSKDESSHYWEATSASEQLALGVRDVALTLGFASGLRPKLINGITYWITHWSNEPQGARKTKLDIFSRANTIERKQFAGWVFNLSVDKDESYSTPSFTVHNCRVVVVCKMAFPNLRDKRVNARLYSPGGQQWMITEVLAKLVQSSGRAMRAEDDACETWILDSQFVSNVWAKGKNLLPSWWVESLDWSGGGI